MSPSLSETLVPSQDQDDRTLRMLQHLSQREELALHQKAGGGRLEKARDAGDGRVRPVADREGVVDVARGETRQRLGEAGVVRLLLLVEAEVLEQKALSGLQGPGELHGERSDAVRRERDRLTQQLLEPEQHGLQRVAGVATALGPPEVRGQHDGGPARETVLERRDDGADARIVGDHVSGQRHVEVGPQEYAPAARSSWTMLSFFIPDLDEDGARHVPANKGSVISGNVERFAPLSFAACPGRRAGDCPWGGSDTVRSRHPTGSLRRAGDERVIRRRSRRRSLARHVHRVIRK